MERERGRRGVSSLEGIVVERGSSGKERGRVVGEKIRRESIWKWRVGGEGLVV